MRLIKAILFFLVAGNATTPETGPALVDLFDQAVAFVKNKDAVQSQTLHIDIMTKFNFYAAYKQATVGPCNTEEPWTIQLTARAKWNTWKALGDMTREDAMSEYITLLDEVVPSWRD